MAIDQTNVKCLYIPANCFLNNKLDAVDMVISKAQ